MPTVYAKFHDPLFARKALRRLRLRLGANGCVQVLRKVSRQTIPLRMTAAGTGVVRGALFVGALAAFALGAVCLFGPKLPVLGSTLAVGVSLSVLLGGLAGGLSFSTDNGERATRVRKWLARGDHVLRLEAPRAHEDTLRHLGAVSICKVE